MAAKYFIVQGYEVDPNQLPHPDHGLPGPQPPFPGQPGPPLHPGWPTVPGWPGGSLPGGGGGAGPPIAGWPGGLPGGGGFPGQGGPVDPGYSPPWARPQPPRPGWPTVPGWPGGSLPGGIEGFPHPSHPIYIPITPPPESGLEPTHPIYIPVYPDNSLPGPQPSPGWPTVPGWPGGSLPGGGSGFPGGPPVVDNTLPGPQPTPPKPPITPEQIEKLKAFVGFLFGNLPPGPETPPTPTPVA
jgi:hypothetical protein